MAGHIFIIEFEYLIIKLALLVLKKYVKKSYLDRNSIQVI